MKRGGRTRLHRGFSLVEVALALAVAGLAVMSVVGLMPMLLDSERKNNATSVFPSMCSQVMGTLRTKPYPVLLPTSAQFMYFTDQGVPTTAGNSAVYECEVTHRAMPVELPRPGGANPPTPGLHCQIVQMKFHWPAGAPGGESRVFHTTLAHE